MSYVHIFDPFLLYKLILLFGFLSKDRSPYVSNFLHEVIIPFLMVPNFLLFRFPHSFNHLANSTSSAINIFSLNPLIATKSFYGTKKTKNIAPYLQSKRIISIAEKDILKDSFVSAMILPLFY